MGDDVICIDSDDDDEDDANATGRTQRARAGSRRASGRGYWQQRRRAQRARRKLESGGPGASPLAALLDGLRRLSSEMSFAAVPSHSVAQQVHRLIGEFERCTPLPEADRQEGWRQVLRFLLVLRAVGGLSPGERDLQVDTGPEKNRQEVERQPGNRQPNNKGQPYLKQRRQSCHRYQLTVIDILVDYIRFRCETVTSRQPPPTPAVLLQECNRIVSHLFVIFDGSVELVTLTLLRTTPEQPGYTVLLYPVFEAILTGEAARGDGGPAGGIPAYVRLLLCFKRWRSLVTGRADKAVIDIRAGQFLPARCPTIQAASDVPLLRLLAPVPPAQRANETRFLLANDLFNLDQCIAQFFRHHCRSSAAADERQPSNNSRPAAPATLATRLTAMELGSHYINVALLAELIERKGHLWARAFPPPPLTNEDETEVTPLDRCLLTQEAHSIVESLRLIFRQRTEFIELTLLRVSAVPEHAPLLAPVFAAFLATPADAGPLTSTTTVTGLSIYRTNDVETYARLILCYAKWKALYRASAATSEETIERTRIDTIALSQLPFDCPRVLCPRDARLRNVFIARPGSIPIGAAVVAPAGRTHQTVTGMLLRTLPNRADLHELCLKFIEAYRGGMQDVEPRARRRTEDSMMTCSTAYKSMSTLIDRTDHWNPGWDIRAASSARLSPKEPCPGIGAEMKPIIIPDSDDGDETSAGDTVPASDQSTVPTPAPSSPSPATSPEVSLWTVAVAGSGGAEQPDRNASNTPASTGESVADAGAASCWPAFVECFLNTPPATPQQEVVTEPADEDQRRGMAVRKPHPAAASWCRLKGTVRSIGRTRKKRTTMGMTVAVRRTLQRVFDDGDGAGGGCWWSFADVLAVQIPFALDVRWCSSIIKIPVEPLVGCARDAHLAPVGRLMRQEADAASNNPPELATHRPSSPDDALLLELIGCLDAPDSSISFDWTPSGCVDFAIPPDNPDRADGSQPNAVEDRASPSAFGGPLDTFPLFASGSDRFVHLLTALGPASWPIV